MAYMVLQVALPLEGYAELEGPNISYWAKGETAQVMPLDVFMTRFPVQGQYLIDSGAVKVS